MRTANHESVEPVILGIIPARAGSKRCPGKNTRLYKGCSLIDRAMNQAIESKLLTACLVSTDDPEVMRICASRGFPYVVRSPETSTDTATSDAVVREVLETQAARWIVLLQPTSPKRGADDIDRCIGLGLAHDGSVSVNEETGGRNGSVYVCRANPFRGFGGLIEYPMPADRSLDIDYPEEFAL